jgi:excisionase family DNA binding protein
LLDDTNTTRLGLSVRETAVITGLGRSTIYEALASGRLLARKLGRRTVILESDLRAWLESLPPLRHKPEN